MAEGNEVSRSHVSVSPEMAEARDAMDAWVETNNLEALVSGFAQALLDKLVAAENKYDYQGAWKKQDWRGNLVSQLNAHIGKGDALDVAAYCAFAWHHGWSLQGDGKWQPIGTAPKDGLTILGFIPSDYGIEVIWFRQSQWHCYRGDDVLPTHWMPLPVAPASDGFVPN